LDFIAPREQALKKFSEKALRKLSDAKQEPTIFRFFAKFLALRA
jgi:hypothetical protein